MPRSLNSKALDILVSIAVIVIVVCFVLGDFALYGGLARREHEKIVREFQMITPPPQAFVKTTSDNYRPPWRNHQGTVATSYSTTADNESIRQHYDQELVSKGWRRVLDHPLTSWGKDSDELAVFYCKQALYAELYLRGPAFLRQYPGADTYAFSVSWGNRPPELEDKCR